MPTIATKYDLALLKKEQIAKNTDSFYFERPDNLDFLPGQFMRMLLDFPKETERGNGRFFSIASSPTQKDYLMITVRIRDSEFKKTLLNLQVGARVQITLPYGAFILKPEETGSRVLIAGGIGITPFHSMIKYASDLKLDLPITLLSSSSLVEDIVFQKELREIETNNNWFKFVETITQPANSQLPWTGNTGRIDTQFIRKYVPDPTSSIFYIAGPPHMVDAIDVVLKSMGIDISRIRKEKFTGY